MPLERHPFRIIRNLGRTREIVAVLLNHGFGDIVDRIGLREFWSRWWFFSRKKRQPRRHLRLVERVRLSLESLGPTFIKFGQVMSTRPDLVPPEMLEELKRLQESVPPFDSLVAIAEIERELDKPISQLFAEFDPVPIAAGSLAQVHRARHFDGTPLAVKVRRPHVVRDVERDLSLMQELATLAERHVPESRVFDPVGLVNHFARSIRREVNFSREGRSMDEFRRLFARDPDLYVPVVYWELTSEAVLTMEFVTARRVDEVARFPASEREPADVAARGARVFLKQAFQHGVFHGDPHPGNLRVRDDGTICLLDYGMIGILDPDVKEDLIDLLMAISQRDIVRTSHLVLKIGGVTGEVDTALLYVDLQDYLGNYFGVPLEHLSVSGALSDFVAILATHHIRCPGSLMLLIRVIITLDGVGRALDPGFNLTSELRPFVISLIKQRYSPRAVRRRLQTESVELWRLAGKVPHQFSEILEKLSHDDLRVKLEHRGIDFLVQEIDRSSNRLVVGVVVSALILASAILIHSGTQTIWLSVPIYATSSILAMWLIYGIFRSGRL